MLRTLAPELELGGPTLRSERLIRLRHVIAIGTERLATFGEEVCAWIVLRPGDEIGEDDNREFCRGRIAH